MVPVSTIRPCLLKCLFKTQTPESVLRHQTQTSPTTPSDVVAHSDSSWYTLPLPPPVEYSSSDALPGSQADARLCGHQTAGRFSFATDWHLRRLVEGDCTLVHRSTPVNLSQWTCFYLFFMTLSLQTPLTPLRTTLCEDAGSIVLSSPHKQKLHLYWTCSEFGNGTERHTGRKRMHPTLESCAIFYFLLLLLDYSTPWSSLCVIAM